MAQLISKDGGVVRTIRHLQRAQRIDCFSFADEFGRCPADQPHMGATAWITYAWRDNEHGDVDFIAQELGAAGVATKLDRWNIGAGSRLWEQIERFIRLPSECDGWILVATANSLQSEPCKEEYAYALDRALRTRGGNFPVIGLFLGQVDEAIIPSGITSRLYVSITDPNWKERIVAALNGLPPTISRPEIHPYHVREYPRDSNGRIAIELRPRAGFWQPFFAAIPIEQKERAKMHIMPGPMNSPTHSGMLFMSGEGPSDDGKWWCHFAGNRCDPTTSFYLWFDELPSTIVFGTQGKRVGEGLHVITNPSMSKL